MKTVFSICILFVIQFGSLIGQSFNHQNKIYVYDVYQKTKIKNYTFDESIYEICKWYGRC